ncbi:MAG: energy transducer TonB [Woeseiaceae bacterium]|nr:energy transducer TonB [Woeseiaceae bacterium]
MRCFFRLTATIALSGLLFQSAHSSDVDRGSLQDVLDYASDFAREGDSTRAIVVYDMMLRAFARTGNAENLSVVCDELVTNVPAQDVEQLNKSFWNCPEPLLSGWIGDLDPHRSVDPVLWWSPTPRFPSHSRLTEGFVVVLFDISTEGRVENIRIEESSGRAWERSVVRTLQDWRYTPALYNGQPVTRSDVMRRFGWQFE